MLNKLYKKLFVLLHSQGGNVVVMTALSLLVLVAAVGVAMDTSRIALVKINQQNATDNAERSANNFCSNDVNAVKSKTAMQNCIRTQATKYYKANIVQNYMGASGNSNPTIVFDGNNVDISANATMKSVLVKQTVKKSSVVDIDEDGINDNTHKALTDSDYTSQTITVNIKTDASNVSWNAVCDFRNPGQCIIGTESLGHSDIKETIDGPKASRVTWYCNGQNNAIPQECVVENGICDIASVSEGIATPKCLSGFVEDFKQVSNDKKSDVSWKCIGSEGGSTSICKQNICTAPANKHTVCGTGYKGTGKDEVASCKTGEVVWSAIKNDCTSIPKCVNYDISDTLSCPTNYSGSKIKITHYYCDVLDQYKAAVAVSSTILDNCQANPATCFPASESMECDAGYSGNKTRVSKCPDPYATPVWGVWDTSECKVKPTCTPRIDSQTIACPSGKYGSGIVQHKDWTCDSNGNLIAGAWYDYDSNGCSSCGTINISFWDRPLGNEWSFQDFNGETGCSWQGRMLVCPTRSDIVMNQSMFSYIPRGDASNAGGACGNSVIIGQTIGMASNAYTTLLMCMALDGKLPNMESSDNYDIYSYYSEAHPDRWGKYVTLNANGARAIIRTVVDIYKQKNSGDTRISQCPYRSFSFNPHWIMSPIKINIAGDDAKLNIDRSMTFEMSNNSGGKTIITTYGSLNLDEAWLMIDRKGDGLIHNGIVDGDDFFTDHEGLKDNGYHDLAITFAPFIRKDEIGRSYIELRKLTNDEKHKIILEKSFNADKNAGSSIAISPSFDLKLLDVNNNELYASDYFDRIYIDYISVNKKDPQHHNMILQIALVRTLDGQYHFSADQWFEPKRVK